MLRSLAGDAEPGADLGPGVAAAAQPLDRLGYRGVDLVGEIGHEDQGLEIAIADPASVGTQDAPDECAVLVVLDLPPSPFGVNPALTLSGAVLALAGLRWGELAGLQVADRVSIPGPGLRLRRAVLASDGGGLYVDTLKNNRARTVPLVLDLVPIVDRWSAGKAPDAWLFDAPEGGPQRESNWKRSVGWSAATSAVGLSGFRVHDLRHTAAPVWLGVGADPKVVQRVLGHATAAMTMDLYGHMVDANLWQAAQLIGATSGTLEPPGAVIENDEG